MKRSLSVALLSAALAPGVAAAVDQPISGKKLVMVQSTTGTERLVFISRDAILAPTPGGADDPTNTGATLTVSSGSSPESATFDLPAANWTVNGSGTLFRYRNSQAPAGPSAVKVARVKNGKLIKVSAKGTGITLNEASQGSINLVLVSGTRRWCATFGAGTIVRDEPNRFLAKNAPPPAVCAAGGPTTTVTSTTVSTTTSTLAPACPPTGANLGSGALTIAAGTTNCGGPGLVPAPSTPFSGAIFDGNDTKISDLGLGCFYAGGGLSNALPSSQLVVGTTNYLDIGTVDGLALTLTGSAGTGPLTCSLGAGPESRCYNGHPGTNGMGLCTQDSDCGSDDDYCLPLANCYFGAPIPLRPTTPALASCVMQAILTDACAAINLDSGTVSLEVALGVRMYLTQDNASPCPGCVDGVCNAGAREGLPCEGGGFGPENTTVECPPRDNQFIGQMLVNPLSVTTGTAEMVSDSEGNFCPGQRDPGIFGTGFIGRRVQQTGSLLQLIGGTTYAVSLGGNLCLGTSGADLVDAVVGLPGPSSASVIGSVELCVLPDICNTLCNPCTLGPLCDIICNPCLLCVP